LLKRDGRREEAFGWWQQLALTVIPGGYEYISARVELAKYFEWHLDDVRLAAEWTHAALDAARAWNRTLSGDLALDELQHRLERLQRKLDQSRGNARPDTE
jgi:hypothetical protein